MGAEKPRLQPSGVSPSGNTPPAEALSGVHLVYLTAPLRGIPFWKLPRASLPWTLACVGARCSVTRRPPGPAVTLRGRKSPPHFGMTNAAGH